MAYQYDIFLSYSRKLLHEEWVNEVFLPLFEAYIEEALNKDVKIFKDTKNIHGGDAWRADIENGLLHSKIMVPILSTAYFRSEWCKKEYAVMDYRQRQSGYLTREKPNGLIVPLKIFDGNSFPEDVNSTQICDCNDYFLRPGAFINAPKYLDFQNKLKAWVEDVAIAYNNAPDWNDEWKHTDWIEKPWADLTRLDGLEFKTPPTL